MIQVFGRYMSGNDFNTEVHALWAINSASSMPLVRMLDSLFGEYSYYTEAEWPEYNIRPPDTHPLLGSWRNIEGNLFVFLLEISGRNNDSNNLEYHLFLIGNEYEIIKARQLISKLKNKIEKIERKQLKDDEANVVIEKENKGVGISGFIKVVGIFAVIVNAFSLYLRQLPSPKFKLESLATIYEMFLALIHYSALLLLFIIIIVSIGYVLKYGRLLLRRF